jgi:hypothetical protein
VEVDDDGAVEGMDDALEKCLPRYPWLTAMPSFPDDALPKTAVRGAHKRQAAALNDGQLQERFPALRNRR